MRHGLWSHCARIPSIGCLMDVPTLSCLSLWSLASSASQASPEDMACCRLVPRVPWYTIAMKTPPIVSQQEWEAARQQLLVKEKAFTRSRDALAAERRRMPWMSVEKRYEFGGPKGKLSLLDLFEGRRQLIVYRAFFEPGVFGWPEHACRGCSMGADQVAHLAHLNARDTTLVYATP